MPKPKTPKSPWKPQATLVGGQAASRAGRRHQNKLAKRLGADFFDLLDANLQTLEDLHTGRGTARESMKGSTRGLKTVLGETHNFLIAARDAIKAQFPARHPMRTHFGIGIDPDPTSMKATLDALRMFIQGMEQFPTEAAAAALGPDDLVKLKAFLAEIPNANARQEDSKDLRKAATSLLDSTHYAVYSQLNRLKVVVGLDLADDPVAQNEIINPLPGGPPGRKKKTEPPA